MTFICMYMKFNGNIEAIWNIVLLFSIEVLEINWQWQIMYILLSDTQLFRYDSRRSYYLNSMQQVPRQRHPETYYLFKNTAFKRYQITTTFFLSLALKMLELLLFTVKMHLTPNTFYFFHFCLFTYSLNDLPKRKSNAKELS